MKRQQKSAHIAPKANKFQLEKKAMKHKSMEQKRSCQNYDYEKLIAILHT